MNILSIFSLDTNPLSLIPGVRKKQKETLRENAIKFVQIIAREIRDNRFVHAQRIPIHSGSNKHLGGWEGMTNESWRNMVLDLLKHETVRRCEFIPPDGQADWTFDCVSTNPVPRVATLTLDDEM